MSRMTLSAKTNNFIIEKRWKCPIVNGSKWHKPYLPMKYPEYRISMEAALPSSVHSWLKCELEQRGIDSLVYTRYIISLLLQNEDLDCESDIFCPSKSTIKRKGRKPEKKKFSISDEERKKTAAIECLSDVSEEKSDIKDLIDELCVRLKDSEAQAIVSPVVKPVGSGSDTSEDSGTENQNSTQRYYAAFPSLHGKSSPSSSSPSITVESVWKNNPLVKPVSSTLNSADESSSSNDDLEVKKIIKCSSVTYTKPKKARKNKSRNMDYPDQRKAKSSSNKSKHHRHQSSKHESCKQDSKIPSWPPGFAKLPIDPILQASYDTYDEGNCELRTETPKRPNEDLCTKVESILKGMLLPTPEKTYKDLQDVDSENLEEPRQRSNIAVEKMRSCSKVSASDSTTEKTVEDFVQETEREIIAREASVSPELQEQEIWYTQPIGEIFQSPDEETSCSKLRLYKRNSYPLFSPEGNDSKTAATDCVDSSASSPDFDRSRSYSMSSNDSENVLEGSVYMPSWLTEEISADQTEEMSAEMQQVYLSTSFNASSPFGDDQKADSEFTKSLESTLTTEDTGWGEASCSIASTAAGLSLETDLYNPWSINSDENLTPTPEEAKSLESDHCNISGPLSVSLVDWDYLSQFLCESDWASFYMDDSLKSHPQRTCLSSLSQNQFVFDFSLDVNDYSSSPLGMFGIYWWQPIWNEENALSQLWDVNMQKRPKVSPWGCPSFMPVSQVWVTENTFVFYNGSLSDQDSSDEHKEDENTLIPRISIDLSAEPSMDSLQYMDKSEEEVDNLRAYFDRSISLVDVPSVWDESTKGADPKLSKSFELVPSETSAFCDVPRRLIHVHSEPNLVRFRQEFNEGSQSKQHSPQEHLYFSPKTHFRPITPAFAPELSVSKIKQQVCHDLFGGLPTTKTPYQQFHNYEDGSDEDSFIPRFKVKNYCKSIQTGDVGEKVASPADSSDTSDRDTPQTLTLGMIEDIMGEKDDIDCLFPISEDLDAANTDSAYETDYGLSTFDSEQDENAKQSHGHCSYRFKSNSNEDNQANASVVDHGNLGDRMNYSIESFMATFPHTQDWPDTSQSCHYTQGHSQWSDKDDGQFQMASSWPQPHVYPERSADSYHHDSQDMFLMDSHDSWMADLFSDHQHNDGEDELYKYIWASGDQDGTGTTADAYSFDLSTFNDEFDAHLAPGESPPQTAHVTEDIDCGYCDGEIHPSCVAVQCSEQTDNETDMKTLPDTGSDLDNIPVTVNSGDVEWTNPGDYFSVQLVYKDKQSVQDPDSIKGQKSYGSFDLMPMPGEGVLSTELEKEWMHPNAVLYRPSCMQRKPCSFYLEGNCRRADCKFAHDISNITCRFWEEGDCFKGPLCPFLHGYPRVTSPTSAVPVPGSERKDKLNFNNEEFPELTLTVKNGNTSSKRVGKSIKGASSFTKRDKVRKSSSRRYSNKENKVESRLLEKCSSSV